MMKLFLPFVSTAHAQTTSSSLTSLSQVESSLDRIVGFLFDTFWIVAVGMLIWAAILFLTSTDKETIGKAKRIIIYAVIAAAAALLANGIYSITFNILQGK